MDVLTATLTLTTPHPPMNSHRLPLSPSSSSFRSSPLNPHSSHSSCESTKRRSFPASRPLRPFPSIANTKPESAQREEASPSNHAPSQAPKPIELSTKWKGGFIVLGMTQAEFSRQD